MERKNKEPEEFNEYTCHDYWRDKTTPYVTLWINTNNHVIEDNYGYDGLYTGFTHDYEELEDYGVCIGSYDQRNNIDRSRALNEQHIGFMPNINDIVYMVIEDYIDGGTFNRCDHNFRPVKIFKTRKDANDWLQTEEAKRCKDTGYFGGHNEYLIKQVIVE